MEHADEVLNAQLRVLIGITAGIPLEPGTGVSDGQDEQAAAVDDPSCPVCGLPAGRPGQGGPAAGSAPVDSVTSPR